MARIGVGLLGFGTVGTGVAAILQDRLADRFEIRMASVRRLCRSSSPAFPLTSDPFEVVESRDVHVVVEVMGGVEPTMAVLERASSLGKPIVTANKELVAKNWDWVSERREAVRFEAAVAAGIPIISVLETLIPLGAITRISGILNGTTNFILTEMENHGSSFEEVLEEAQALGYAEADPSSDVDGWDSLYKIGVLSAVVSGVAPDLQAPRKGIRAVTNAEIEDAKRTGYRIKLIASWTPAEGARVEPVLVESSDPLCMVSGTQNAVSIEGGPNGPLTLVGVGAGSLPTGSAVVCDLLRLFPA